MSVAFPFRRKNYSFTMTEGVSCTYFSATSQEKFVAYREKAA